MKISTYSHNCIEEDWHLNKVQDVIKILSGIDMVIRRGCAPLLRRFISDQLITKGWSSKIKISSSSQISITAMNEDLALCVQTGNMSRFYADLLKLEYVYRKRSIRASIYILPTKTSASIMGSNLVNFDRFTEELSMFSNIITIPMYVIGIE